MPDDRLDDAIAAVVRAVDRIERATRTVPGPPEGAAPQPGPVAARLAERAAPGVSFAETPATAARAEDPAGQARPMGVPPAPAPAAPTDPTPDPSGWEAYVPAFGGGGGDHPVDLAARLALRAQQLDGHLAEAVRLRAEISELAARIATATERR